MTKILTSQEDMQAFWAKKDLADFEAHRADALPVLARPPLTNRGGIQSPVDNFPRDQVLQKTQLDWFGFTVRRSVQELEAFALAVLPGVFFSTAAGGIKGYPAVRTIALNGAEIGSIAHGASHGRNMFTFSGEAFKRIPRSDYGFLRQCLEALNEGEGGKPVQDRDAVKLTRIDIAFDFYHGEVTWEDAWASYDGGEFDSETGPRPGRSRVGKERGDGTNLGRTMYVGSRSGSKMARIYEKGLQVFSQLPDQVRESMTDPAGTVFGPGEGAPENTIAEDWLRVEIEFKAKDTLLTFDMLTGSDSYFVGAYPFCATVLDMATGKRPPRLKDEAIITLARVVQAMRTSYGNTMTTLLDLGLLPHEIVDMIATGMPNQKLVKAGIVQAVKDDPDFITALQSRDAIPF